MYADPYADPAFAAPVPTYVPNYEVGRSSNFKKLNCCAFLAAIAIFAVMIAAATVCFYNFNQTFTGTQTNSDGSTTTLTINYTRSCYDLQGVTTNTQPSSGTATSVYTFYDSSTSLWSTFKLLQAFVLIALILSGLVAIFLLLCFGDSLRNKLLFVLGMNVLRIFLLFLALLILASLVIAFLGFLGITSAFANDHPGCTQGYCKRFADSNKTDFGNFALTSGTTTTTVDLQENVTFGPDAGWYLVLGCIPVAILLSILVVINKFPIPVDSVGSGEAL